MEKLCGVLLRGLKTKINNDVKQETRTYKTTTG